MTLTGCRTGHTTLPLSSANPEHRAPRVFPSFPGLYVALPRHSTARSQLVLVSRRQCQHNLSEASISPRSCQRLQLHTPARRRSPVARAMPRRYREATHRPGARNEPGQACTVQGENDTLARMPARTHHAYAGLKTLEPQGSTQSIDRLTEMVACERQGTPFQNLIVAFTL